MDGGPIRKTIVAASLALAACATYSQPPLALLDSNLDAMVGQPVAVAVARLGEPIAAAPVGTDTVYGWGRAFTSTELLHASGAGIAPADVQGGVFPPPRGTVQNDCVIRMTVGADGLIRDWDYRGNDRGCRAYAERLAGRTLARID
jgi:hypothetical protein